MRFVYALRYIINSIIDLALLILTLRAIASWIPQVRNSKFGYVLYACTEPLLAPVRQMLFRIPALRAMPIDLSFIAVYILLGALRIIVG